MCLKAAPSALVSLSMSAQPVALAPACSLAWYSQAAAQQPSEAQSSSLESPLSAASNRAAAGGGGLMFGVLYHTHMIIATCVSSGTLLPVTLELSSALGALGAPFGQVAARHAHRQHVERVTVSSAVATIQPLGWRAQRSLSLWRPPPTRAGRLQSRQALLAGAGRAAARHAAVPDVPAIQRAALLLAAARGHYAHRVVGGGVVGQPSQAVNTPCGRQGAAPSSPPGAPGGRPQAPTHPLSECAPCGHRPPAAVTGG
jgi:hypothetical protein